MAEGEENIPMSSSSWLWKKKRNSVFPAIERKSKTEAWIQTDIPPSSQLIEEKLRNNVEFKSQSNIILGIPLPGSVTDEVNEMQLHPAHAPKNATIDEETGCGETVQGQSFLKKNKSLDQNEFSLAKILTENTGNKMTAEKGYPNSAELFHHDHQLVGCLSTEELPYIPYRLAKLYITKIAKDMHEMKNRYVKVIKELEHVRGKSQEQAIVALKDQYNEKLKNLRTQLEFYQEMVDKKKQQWQDTKKRLEEDNRKLRQEKEELVNQIQEKNEKTRKDKAWLLENITQKLHCLYIQHTLTIKELYRCRLDLEKVQKMVAKNRVTEKNAAKIKSDSTAQDGQNSVVVEVEMQDYLPERNLLWEIDISLAQVTSSLLKRETEISELLQSELWYSPQITKHY